MGEIRYTVGLLIASCLLLTLAIALSWAGINEYKERAPVVSAPAVRQVPAPAEVPPAAPPEETVGEPEGPEAPAEASGEAGAGAGEGE